MRIYITTQGSRVIKEGRHLLVRRGEDTHRTIFIHKVAQLIVCGKVEITPAARNMLFRNNVDTVFLTRNGRYVGRYSGLEPKNVELRKRQFHLVDEPDFGINFSRQLVAGKLANMSTLLMRIHRSKKKDHVRRKAKQIRNLIPVVQNATSINSLRGYEGQGSALYFNVFNSGFSQDQGFTHRVRRPPTDEVNAVLSLLYTFLYNQVYSAVRQVNLDPYIGHLHSLDYGRYSLVLDLMEEYRTVIVDTLVLALFNMGVLNKERDFVSSTADHDWSIAGVPSSEDSKMEQKACDRYGLPIAQAESEQFDTPVQRISESFEMRPPQSAGKPPVLLTADAMKKVIGQFERKLATPFHYMEADKKINYAEALLCQVRQYRKYVEGSIVNYKPLQLR